MDILLIVIIVFCAVIAILGVVNIVLISKKTKINSQSGTDEIISAKFLDIYDRMKDLNNSQLEIIKIYNSSVVEKIASLTDINDRELKLITNKLTEVLQSNENKMDKLTATLNDNMTKIRENNDKKLEEMRITVDEKLNNTLTDRLNKSFAIVSDQLQAVTKGLGEMQSLASGVGDLKKVLTNVKTRGTFGEVQLGSLLEQMLAPNQYSEQVMLKSGSTERVDYCIIMPGKDEQNIYLPIDAKFPVEDYLRLIDTVENGLSDNIASCQKQLVKRVKDEAKSIKEKYIIPPITTDFAILYLPTEGLYAEVIKQNGLFEELQRDYKITVCGPTTISALLNSLQMGFRSLAIEKRSSEIWTMLATFKKEFSTYCELLTKTQKKLSEATDSIESATKKSTKIQKQLSQVADLSFDDKLEIKNKDEE